MEFNNLEELYQRLLPALEMKAKKETNLTTKDIFQYLSKTKWQKAVDLSLAEMVNDILKVDISLIRKEDFYE